MLHETMKNLYRNGFMLAAKNGMQDVVNGLIEENQKILQLQNPENAINTHDFDTMMAQEPFTGHRQSQSSGLSKLSQRKAKKADVDRLVNRLHAHVYVKQHNHDIMATEKLASELREVRAKPAINAKSREITQKKGNCEPLH